MIIDCHGHYTTAPKGLQLWRDDQLARRCRVMAMAVDDHFRAPVCRAGATLDSRPQRRQADAEGFALARRVRKAERPWQGRPGDCRPAMARARRDRLGIRSGPHQEWS